ncbi:MAG: hypothetical protein JWM74_1586 [Myxococcaceae bacterium]|nr:hypothetical protein [Myxococcaceae bacterium]
MVVTLLACSGCKREPQVNPGAPDGGPTSAASSAPVILAHSAAPTATPATAATLTAFAGTLGSQSDARVLVDRRGDEVVFTVDTGSGLRSLHGKVAGTHFVATETAVAKGHQPITFEGQLMPQGLRGTYKEPESKASLAFVGAALTTFDPAPKFDETYTGALGAKIRIRAKLSRDGTKLSGVYRYARSKEDLVLAGTVQPDGHFELTETTSKGVVTGKMEGLFLRRGDAAGRWSSPDGSKTFPMTLERGEGYPEIVTLTYGGKITPQEDRREPRPHCVLEAIFPQVAGSKSKVAEAALNAKLLALGKHISSDVGLHDPSTCEGASAEMPYSVEAGFDVSDQRGRYVGLSFSVTGFTGGAHGFGGSTCYVADLDTGNVIELSPLLSPAGRTKLGALTTEKLKKEHHVAKLTEADFFEDTVAVTPKTSLCLEPAGGLVVDFQDYEVTPHAVGPQSASFTKEEVRALFTKSEMTDALFK